MNKHTKPQTKIKQVITVTSVNEHEQERQVNQLILYNFFKSTTIDPIFRKHLPVDIINLILDVLLSV